MFTFMENITTVCQSGSLWFRRPKNKHVQMSFHLWTANEMLFCDYRLQEILTSETSWAALVFFSDYKSRQSRITKKILSHNRSLNKSCYVKQIVNPSSPAVVRIKCNLRLWISWMYIYRIRWIYIYWISWIYIYWTPWREENLYLFFFAMTNPYLYFWGLYLIFWFVYCLY